MRPSDKVQPMKAAALLAVAMLLTISVAAIAGGGASGQCGGCALVMPLHPATARAGSECASADDRRPAQCGCCGMLPERTRGIGDRCGADAAWRTLDLPPPVR